MPEGNTIHWLARRHTRDLANHIVRVGSPQGRFAKEAKLLDRLRFRKAEAYGKHLFHHWQGGLVVHVHLGMAGWFYRFRGRPPEPRPTVRMRLAAEGVTIDLIGPPTCELIKESGQREIVARLGPDPLRADADSGVVLENLRRRSRPIGDALLDQRVLSGVGNIYRNEALFLAGDPLELRQVIAIVPRLHADEHPDTLLAALRMHCRALEVGRLERAVVGKVPGAQRGECPGREAGVERRIEPGPGVLVVRLDHVVGLGDHLPDPETGADLDVGHVRDDLAAGPLAGPEA